MQLVRRMKPVQGSSPMLRAAGAVPLAPVLVGSSTPPRSSPRAERLDRVSTAPARYAALLTGDTIAAAGSFAIAYGVAAQSVSDTNGLFALAPWIASVFAGVVLHLASHGHYFRRLPRLREFRDLLASATGALLATAFAAYVTQNEQARWAVIGGWLAWPFLALVARAAARAMLQRAGLWRIPVLIVGDSANADAATEAIGSAGYLGYEIVGTLAPAQLPPMLAAHGWRGVLANFKAHTIVLATDAAERPSPTILEALVRDRIPVAVLHDTAGLPALACENSSFPGHETMLLRYATSRDKPVSRLLKAAIDVTLAALGLIILAPLLAVIAIAVKTDGGPVLYAHRRLGSGGRNFNCLKFRTMVQDSDAVLAKLLAEDPHAEREWAATQKLRHDPRVTWIGRILRKTSLDELPQLINVVRLEMSLVGPRPIVSREVSRYADDIAYYYEARPGITGLWQISGRNETTYERRVQLDRWYVKNWTLGQDIEILARTIPAVMSGRGAS